MIPSIIIAPPVQKTLSPVVLIWRENTAWSVYDTKFFISLFERAFKMMKNGIYFIVI